MWMSILRMLKLMHVISRKALRLFWTKFPDAEEQLAAWFKVAEHAAWTKWADVKATYPKASIYKCCLIFNICGNKYRLIVKHSPTWKDLFVAGAMTHHEYDAAAWKKYCNCP